MNKDDLNNMISKKIKSKIKNNEDKPRSMSSHVVSRWYRAPEIILIEKYD